MNPLEATLIELAETFSRLRVRYMVIGGLASLQWGRARLTYDVDVTVAVDEPALEGLLAALAPRIEPLLPDAMAFAREASVVPMESSVGVRVDLVIAALDYELEAISRAAVLDIQGHSVRFATAEDLILHKIVSERARDAEDIEGIVARQRGKLDLDYLRPRVASLAQALERPQMLAEFERLVRGAGA